MTSSSNLRLAKLLRRFADDVSGNFAVLLALSAVPLVLMMGLGIDYFRAQSLQARLNAAADAAAVAAVNAASAYVQANSGNQGSSDLITNAKSAGASAATNIFVSNLGNVIGELNAYPTPHIDVERQSPTSNVFVSTVTYYSGVNTAFGPLIGINSLPVDGKSAATANFPAYMDIYFLIDNSDSMGIGATSDDQNRMQSSSASCTVACHSPWWNGTWWPYGTYDAVRAISPVVNLRIDVVKQSVINELNIIKAQTFNNQVRVAIYTFSNTLVQVHALDSNIDNAIADAQTIDLATGTGQGGTYATYNITQFTQNLPSPGDGTSASSRLGNVLLFTDGVQDSSNPASNGAEDRCGVPTNYVVYPPAMQCNPNADPSNSYEWNKGFQLEGFNPADCDGIKNLGYTMYTLDFIYDLSSLATTDSRYDFIASTLNPSIQTNLAACATKGTTPAYASTSQDFDAALSNLIQQVFANARITQ